MNTSRKSSTANHRLATHLSNPQLRIQLAATASTFNYRHGAALEFKMKARKPDTDQVAEVIFCVNGKPATEYDLAGSGPLAEADIVECFVPVEDGDRITVTGKFSGSVLNGSFDLLLDGSFVADSRIEGKELKYVPNRGINFKRALNCPIPSGWKSIESPKEMEEGTMHTKRLDQGQYGGFTDFELASPQGVRPGLGSLQVIIYVNQAAGERHYDKHADITVGHWRNRTTQLARKSSILPDYELKLEVDTPDVPQKRSLKHRRHWDGTRFGNKPWAKIVFYYRSKAAITSKGCSERPDRVQDLEVGDKDTFIFAEPKPNNRQQSGKADKEDDTAAASPAKDTERTPLSDTDLTNDMDRTPSKEQRQTPKKHPNKRLGGALGLPKATGKSPEVGAGQPGRRSPKKKKKSLKTPQEPQEAHPSNEPGETELSFLLAVHDSGEKGATSASGSDVFPSPSQAASHMSRAGNQPSIGWTGVTSWKSDVANSHASEQACDTPPSPAVSTSLHPPASKETHDSVHTEPVKDDKNNLTVAISAAAPDMSSSNAVLAAIERELPSHAKILEQIGPEGVDDFYFHLLYIDVGPFREHEQMAVDAFERRKQEVATRDPDTGLWFRKEGFALGQKGDAPRRDSALRDTEAVPAEVPQEASHLNSWLKGADRGMSAQPEPDDLGIKQEEVDFTITPDTPTPVLAAPSTPQHAKTPASSKRTASERGRSSPPGTASPAAKRAKKQGSGRKAELQQILAEKAAKKAEMERQLKAKNEAKAAAKEAKREAKRRREAEEAEEIAKLERQNADFDAELAAMQEQLQDSDDDENEDDEEGEVREGEDEDEESEAE